jgi:hypothetical protein
MSHRIVPALLVMLLPALTLAASDVPLPRPRPAGPAAPASPSAEIPLPRERPSEMAASSEEAAPAASAANSAEPVPAVPPPRVYQVGCPALLSGEVSGRTLPPIQDGQCGLQSPLSIEAVSANGRSIALNAPVVTDCGMASALPAWVGDVDRYVTAHDKTTIVSVNIGTGYACRNVDNAAAGNLSFHAFADALDVIGFTLADGRTISIAPGFNGTPEEGRDILHFARDAACTHFTTVLGPEADAFHQDNLHLDLGCHGKSCTARLCE